MVRHVGISVCRPPCLCPLLVIQPLMRRPSSPVKTPSDIVNPLWAGDARYTHLIALALAVTAGVNVQPSISRSSRCASRLAAVPAACDWKRE